MALKDVTKSPDFQYLQETSPSEISSKMKIIKSTMNLLQNIRKKNNKHLKSSRNNRKNSKNLDDYNTLASRSKREVSLKRFYSRLKSSEIFEKRSNYFLFYFNLKVKSQKEFISKKKKDNLNIHISDTITKL